MTIRVSNVGVSSVIDADKQFEVYHKTTSNDYDLHKLSMTIPCYALGMQFKEVLGCGKDDQFQLANLTNCERYAEFKYTKEDNRSVSMPQK